MKLVFRKITIENFFSLGNVELELNDRGYVFVKGINNNTTDNALSNGSGKSSLWEAISWCLCGETIRGGCKDVVNLNTQGGTLVTLEFDVDGISYLVMRTKEHKEYKTNLKIFVDGVDKSGKGIRDSEKLLKEYLPELTSSLIGSVIILGQGMPQRFSNNTPSGRKEVLEKLSKSDFMIQDLKDRVTARKQELNSELRTLQDKSLELNTALSIRNAALADLDKTISALNETVDYDTLIGESGQLISECKSNLLELEAVRTKANEELNKIREEGLQVYAHQEEAKSKIEEKWQRSLNEADAKVQHTKAAHILAKAEYERLSVITDICPTCKQKLPDVHKPDLTEALNNLTTAEAAYNQATEEYTTLQSFKRSELAVAQEECTIALRLLKSKEAEQTTKVTEAQVSYNECNTVFVNEQARYNRLLSDRDNHQANLTKAIDDRNNTKQLIDATNEELTAIQANINDVETRLTIINKFNTIVTRDFRGHLLLNVIEYINNKAKEYAKEIFFNDKIEFKLDGNALDISFDNKQYEMLSGGERQKVDLIVQFAIRDMMCTFLNFSSNILVVDEIFDNLDKNGCEQVINLISKQLRDISSIYIVSHHTDIAIPYDDEITVMKNANGVSYIK